MAVYTFTSDSTPPMPGSHLDRAERLATQADEFGAALLSGDAWERWCDGLRAAGRAILRSEDAVSDTDRAEGYRYLMGLVSHLLAGELYATDAENPAFTVTASDVVKVGMDNPDATLLHAPISDDGVFRVYGTVRSIRMLEFVVSGGPRPAMYQLQDFAVDDDDSFSLLLAADEQPGNWIELPPGARSLLVRRVQYDWDTEEIPHLAIERVDAAPGVVPRCLRVPTAAEVGEQLDALATLVETNADYWVDMVHSFRDEGDNVVPAPRPLPATGMNPSRSSVKGFFVLEPDEALVVSFAPPDGRFWSISVGDMWYRTFDYSHHQTSLNGHQATIDTDGRCRFVISGSDPGVPNWLDTVGHARGVVCIRWVMTDSRPQPETRVVRLDELDEVLPADTARVTPADRAAVIERRKQAVARRWAVPLTTRWSYSTATIDPPRPA